MRVVRSHRLPTRLAAVTVIGLTLAACSGGSGPQDLTQEQVQRVVLGADAIPGGGWTAGPVDTHKTGSAASTDELLKNAKDLDPGCRDALRGFSRAASEEASAYGSRAYTKGSGADAAHLTVVVQVMDDAGAVPDRLADVATACRRITMATGDTTLDLTGSAPDVGVPDSQALQLAMDVMGQKLAVTLAAAARGHHLVVVQTQGADADAVARLVGTALDKQVHAVQTYPR